MLRGLQVGCGELNRPSTMDEVAAIGVQLARIKPGPDRETTQAIVRQVTVRGMRPLVIVDRVEHVFWIPRDIGCDVDGMNEPDIGTDNGGRGPVTPRAYRLFLAEVHAAVWSRQCDGQDMRLWAGSISNPTERSLDWLSEVMSAVPWSAGVSIHWYPHRTLRGPHPGYSSRHAELTAFLGRIGTRRWMVSETGWHTAPQPRGWFRRPVQWTDEQVAETAAAEFAWWEHAGAYATVLYQLNDGSSKTALDRYGIRRSDGSYKPVADIFRGDQ